MIEPDEILAIAGEGRISRRLGSLPGHQDERLRFPVWEVNLPLDSIPQRFEYKFLILSRDGKVKGWEAMNNRVFGVVREVKSQQIVIVDGTRFCQSERTVERCRHGYPPCSESGLKDDFGVGDFLDIKKMVDWCVKTGQKVLQILPINDTTMTRNLGGLLSL